MSDDRKGQREAFMLALEEAMAMQGMTQRKLALALDWSSHTRMQPWKNGHSEPHPEEVFAIEEALRVPPGTLSQHLGYVPVEAEPAEAPFGDLLFRHRGRRTQADVAAAVGIAQGHYSGIEAGRRVPSLPVFLRLIRELDIDPGEALAAAEFLAALSSG